MFLVASPSSTSAFRFQHSSLMCLPKRSFAFYREKHNFTVVSTKRPFIFTGKYNILQLYLRRPFVFLQQNAKLWTLYPSGHSLFYNEIDNFESCTQTSIRISHKEIRNLAIYHQSNLYSPTSTTASSNQWFIAGKAPVKKWVLIKTPCKNNEWKLKCDDMQKKQEITAQGSCRKWREKKFIK